eukprot:10883197-Alexandrium_andersonii.AAC.1
MPNVAIAGNPQCWPGGKGVGGQASKQTHSWAQGLGGGSWQTGQVTGMHARAIRMRGCMHSQWSGHSQD